MSDDCSIKPRSKESSLPIPKNRVVDELELVRGEVRIDVAVIGDIMHGYEIKSAKDNLLRLPNQQLHYGKVL
jgi:hypothetical protein